MDLLQHLVTDFANAVRYLIPAFCYVAGGVLLIVAVVMLESLGRNPRAGAPHYLGVVLVIVVASLLLSFDNIVNLSSATLGGDQRIGLGGGLLAYSTIDLAGGTLQQMVGQLIEVFKPAIMGIGALSILVGILKLRKIGKSSGTPAFNSGAHFVAGVFLLNIQMVADRLLSGG